MHPRSHPKSHLRPHTTALLLTLALTATTTTKSRADTYVWSGNSANFSDPSAWIGPSPTPNGSPSDQLLFPDTPPNSNYTITLDAPGPVTLNTLTLGSDNHLENIPGLTATINALSNASLLFDGPNPTITLVPTTYLDTTTLPSHFADSSPPTVTSTVPITSTSNLAIAGSGTFGLIAPLSFTQPDSQLNISAGLYYQTNTSPTNLGQTNINNGQLILEYIPTGLPEATLTFGSGTISLNNGEIGISAPQSDPNSFIVDFNNNITLQGQSSIYSYGWADGNTGEVRFNGTLHLNGFVQLACILSMDYAGTIELDESGGVQPTIYGFVGNACSTVTLSGNIVDDPNPSHLGTQPLVLYGYPAMSVTGTHNTYSIGTDIQFGNVFVAPNSSLGTGSAIISTGTLHISSPTNIAANRQVLVENYGTLAIAFDADPSTLIDPASNGSLALDINFTTPLNESTLGNGMMSLGSTNSSTYTPSTLAPGIDHTYRFSQLGLTGNSLILQNSVLIDYNNIPSSAQLAGVTLAAPNSYSGGSTIIGDVFASAPGALGIGNITIGSPPFYGQISPGRLYITSPNTYAANATVNIYGILTVTGANSSIPLTAAPPIFHPGSTLVLGDNLTNNSDLYPDTMPLNLNTSTLQLNGIGTTNETVGPISFSGLSTILIQNPFPNNDPPANNSTTLTTSSITQNAHAVLLIESTYAAFDPNQINNAAFYIKSPTALINGILPPYIQMRSSTSDNSPLPTFLTYTPYGVAPATYVSFPSNGGTGTEIADIPYDIDINNNVIPFILPMTTSVYALRIATSIANPSAGPATLHILSGGLIIGPYNQDLFIAPNIDFGNTEAYINAAGDTFSGPTVELAGQVTATNGITKFGSGTILFSNPNNNISGPINIYEGGLSFLNLPEPNSPQPIQMSTGTSLNFTTTTTLTRPINLSADGLNFGLNATITTSPDQSLTLAAPITGNEPVTITSANSLNVNYPINFNSALTLAGNTVHLSANITADYIGVNGTLTGSGTLTSRISNTFTEGTISPGDHPGDIATIILDTPNSEIGNGEAFDFDLTPAGLSDRILITGDLLINPYNPSNSIPPTILNLNFLSPPTGQTYTLISYASLTGTFATINGLPSNYSLDYTPTALLLIPNNGTPTNIPEPTTLTLLTLTTPLFLRRRCK